jgi:opacity protein-like surface antigen
MILLATAAGTASAQQRVPDRGMFALGLNFGFAIPHDELVETGIFTSVSGEYYLTPRVSLKAQFGGSWFDTDDDDVGFEEKVSPMHLTGSVVYNWERGKVHPYATAGAGWYRYRFRVGEDSDEDVVTDSKFGVSLGGGAEYFLSRSDTIVANVTFHVISGDTVGSFFAYNGSFWSFSGGYKKYF